MPNNKAPSTPGLGELPPSLSSPSRWTIWSINFVGVMFILTSLGQMVSLLNFSRWDTFFQDHSRGFVQCLYLISWGTAVMGMVAGAGLLSRKECFRKLGIFFLGISIVAAYGRHPHAGFLQRMHSLSREMAASGQAFGSESVVQFGQAWNIPWMNESGLAWGCVIFVMLLETLLVLMLIFLLTRPSMKNLFK